ncbi:2-aminomuconic 6-semialdehyde dehydrogenase [Dirofilaria immitis]
MNLFKRYSNHVHWDLSDILLRKASGGFQAHYLKSTKRCMRIAVRVEWTAKIRKENARRMKDFIDLPLC